MVRDPLAEEDDPDADAVLAALHDESCRTILESLEEPKTAQDLLGCCDIPRSTLYRKLDTLASATLVREGTELRADGSHATRYEIDFEEVIVTRGDGGLDVEIERPARRADERFAELWSEVRREL
jgi:DNA-binding transcriptional ArsR family regulator